MNIINIFGVPLFFHMVQCSEGSMFRKSFVQKVLYLKSSIFRTFYIQKVLCSEASMFRNICAEGPLFRKYGGFPVGFRVIMKFDNISWNH